MKNEEGKSEATRREQLLAEAAKAFDSLSSPFDSQWLSEHEVTLDECGDLSEDVARAIRFYLRTPKDERLGAAVQDAAEEAGLPREIAAGMAASYRMSAATRRLKEMNR